MPGTDIMNLEKLQPEVQKKFAPYLESMMDMYGNDLIAVFVYGSSASGGYVRGTSSINSAFVFNELKFPVLKKSLKIISKGISKSIAAPLFLTKEYIFSSLDVFPIEFMDMKENHILVYGEDIFSAMDVKGEHARLFCEQQVKGKLVRIRQAYLEVGLSRKGMISLMKESLNSLIPVFRNLIRLKGETSPADNLGIIERLSGLFGLETRVFTRVYQDSIKDKKVAPGDVEALIDQFMGEIEKLSVMVDKL